jgi:hypothetical protein
MTCGELIHQEEQYIREYAAVSVCALAIRFRLIFPPQYYDIPIDLKRGTMLERICALHPGSAPSIPVLHHFTFERADDGRIRITGHNVPPGSSTLLPNKTMHSRPRSDGPPARLHYDHAAPASIIPKELYPTKRFPTPIDTYSPSPSRGPSPVPRSPRSEFSGVPLPKPRMEFVYPPKPRARAHRRQCEDEAAEHSGENAREFSPGPPWLEKMLVDLEHGRKDLVGDLEEVKREARDVLYDVTRLQILVESEQGKTKALVGWLKRVMGDEVAEKIIAEATQAAEERTSDEEEAEEGEDDESNSEGHSSDDNDNEGDDDDDEGDDDGDEGDEHAIDGHEKS